MRSRLHIHWVDNSDDGHRLEAELSTTTGFSSGRHCSKSIAKGLSHHLVGSSILYLQNCGRNSGNKLGGRELMAYATIHGHGLLVLDPTIHTQIKYSYRAFNV